MKLIDRLEKQLENKKEESYKQIVVDSRTGNIKLKVVRELLFGSNQYERKILEIEDEIKKKEGFTHSVIHRCGIKHYLKHEPIEKDVDVINKTCPCSKKKEMQRKGLFLKCCPSGHATWENWNFGIMWSCRHCTELMNIDFQKETPEQIEQREKQAEINLKKDKARKLYEEFLEAKEIEKQAKILARAEVLKEEMKKK